MRSESPLRLLLLFAALFGVAATTRTHPAEAAPRAAFGTEASAQIDPNRGLPLYFLASRGPLDSRAAFRVPGRDKQIFFAREDITFLLTPQTDGRPEWAGNWAVKMIFLDPGKDVRLVGAERANVRFYDWQGSGSGADSANAVRVTEAYHGIRYRDLWPGIDLALSLDGNRVKYEFRVRPGADPDQIRWTYEGAETAIATSGELEITTPVAGFRDGRPWAYQVDGGGKRGVEAAYRPSRGPRISARPQVTAAERNDDDGYGFLLGPYDTTKPLVIDPAVAVYAGFLGGSGQDAANGIAIDEDGHAYLVGTTRSTEAEFPVTTGPQTELAGSADVFVAKVDPSGTKLVFAGYLGGSRLDEGADIALDRQGNIYVTGLT